MQGPTLARSSVCNGGNQMHMDRYIGALYVYNYTLL